MPDRLSFGYLNAFFFSSVSNKVLSLFHFLAWLLIVPKEPEFVKQVSGLGMTFVGMETILLTFCCNHLRLVMDCFMFIGYYLLG